MSLNIMLLPLFHKFINIRSTSSIILSLSTLLFAIPWGKFWIFLITAIAAMIFDSQFIIIQRYNRPRVIKVLEKRTKILVKNKHL